MGRLQGTCHEVIFQLVSGELMLHCVLRYEFTGMSWQLKQRWLNERGLQADHSACNLFDQRQRILPSSLYIAVTICKRVDCCFWASKPLGT